MSIADLKATTGGDSLSAGTPLVTPRQLAQWLQVSRRSLARMRSAGQLPPPLRFRNAVRWRASDIEAWLAAGCPASPEN